MSNNHPLAARLDALVSETVIVETADAKTRTGTLTGWDQGTLTLWGDQMEINGEQKKGSIYVALDQVVAFCAPHTED